MVKIAVRERTNGKSMSQLVESGLFNTPRTGSYLSKGMIQSLRMEVVEGSVTLVLNWGHL